MTIEIELFNMCNDVKPLKHPKCKGVYDSWSGDSNCGYDTTLMCEDCKYSVGRKNPEAKCNQIGYKIPFTVDNKNNHGL